VSLSLAKRKNPDYRSGVFFFAFLMRETVSITGSLKKTTHDRSSVCRMGQCADWM